MKTKHLPGKNVKNLITFSALSYFVMATAVAIAIFFVIWGVLQEFDDEIPFVWAGLVASGFLGLSAIFYEIFRRKAQTRILLEKEKLYYQSVRSGKGTLSLEKNKDFVKSIQKKSRLIANFNEHYEVFQYCNDYLRITEKELATINYASPRFAALRNGQEKIRPLHKHHLLRWAEYESQRLTQEAKFRSSLNEKIETAQRALGVIESALSYYPEESALTDSIIAITDFIVSIRVGHALESAEREAFKGNFQQAIDNYQDALFILRREHPNEPERDILAEEISFKVEKLQDVLQNLN